MLTVGGIIVTMWKYAAGLPIATFNSSGAVGRILQAESFAGPPWQPDRARFARDPWIQDDFHANKNTNSAPATFSRQLHPNRLPRK